MSKTSDTDAQQRVAADRSIVFHNSLGIVLIRAQLPGPLNASVGPVDGT